MSGTLFCALSFHIHGSIRTWCWTYNNRGSISLSCTHSISHPHARSGRTTISSDLCCWSLLSSTTVPSQRGVEKMFSYLVSIMPLVLSRPDSFHIVKICLMTRRISLDCASKSGLSPPFWNPNLQVLTSFKIFVFKSFATGSRDAWRNCSLGARMSPKFFNNVITLRAPLWRSVRGVLLVEDLTRRVREIILFNKFCVAAVTCAVGVDAIWDECKHKNTGPKSILKVREGSKTKKEERREEGRKKLHLLL